ncbi:MAG: EamA family transporter [Solirubrobacterales bacterium]
MGAIALGLVASVSWGVADFVGGVEARRLPVLWVLLISQPVGLGAATVWALSAGGAPPPLIDLAVAAAAGLAGALALGALWAAMARGMIGLASPISATGVLVPVIYGLARGESPGPLQLAGVALAIGGIILAVRPPPRSAQRRPGRDGLSVLFAAAAALGFGAMFVGVAFAAKQSPAWAVCAARAGGCGVIVAGALVARRGPAVRELKLPPLAAIGALDVLGSSLYALATRLGRVSLIAVAASLYPAVTVILAARVVHERLGHSQRAGVLVTLIGIAAIAAGG